MTWKWEAKSLEINPTEFLAKTNRSGRTNIYVIPIRSDVTMFCLTGSVYSRFRGNDST